MCFAAAIEQQQQRIIQHIQELVRIRSVQGAALPGMPFGTGPAEALQKTLDICSGLGFHSVNMDNYLGYAEYGQGEEMLALLTHVDVVPEGIGWSIDPYGAEIKDGRIYGRGSYDDKGACIASIYALKAVRDAGLPLRKRVRLLFGANEESGMADIPYYLSREKQPEIAFSPDSPFPVVYGEKGIVDVELSFPLAKTTHIVDLQAGDNIKFVPQTCSALLNLNSDELHTLREALNLLPRPYTLEQDGALYKLTLNGKTAFAAKPTDGINALDHMLRLLNKIAFIRADMPQVFDFYLQKLADDTTGKGLDIALQDAISTPLTLSPNILKIEAGRLIIQLHIRYPVLCDGEQLLAALQQNARPAQYRLLRYSPAHYLPPESQLVSILMRVYREATGDRKAQPVTTEGGTYARTLRNAVAFGPLFPGEAQVAHAPDEYLNINSIIKATAIYAQAIAELCC